MAGSIEKRGKDKWRLVYSMGFDQDGKRIRKTRTVTAKNKTEARKLLAEFVTEIEVGEYIDPSKMKFKDFVKEWKEKYGNKHLSVSTLETYEYILDGYILPKFGNMRIDEIKPIHIIDYLSGLEKDGARLDGKKGGLSSSSIHYHYRILRDILGRATEWKLIKSNPVESVKRPKVTYKEADIYTEEEAIELFEKLQGEVIHARILITLALTTGMRKGELLALQWQDIDLENGMITVKHSLQYTKVKGYRLVTPKNNAVRIISLTPELIGELKSYKHQKNKERLQAAELWEGGEYNFVFSTTFGKPFYPSVPNTWFRRFAERAVIRYISPHKLRHTSATLLINQGVHAKVISERLGHADIKTTMNTYGHYIKKADEEAANKFSSLFQRKQGSEKQA